MARRGRKNAETLSVWELGNKIRNSSTGDNLMENLPKKVNQQQAEQFLGRCALLETKSPATGKGRSYYNKAFVLYSCRLLFYCILAARTCLSIAFLYCG